MSLYFEKDRMQKKVPLIIIQICQDTDKQNKNMQL